MTGQQPAAAATCPRCSQGPLLTNERPHCPRCGWYERPLSNDRELLEAVAAVYQTTSTETKPGQMTLLELLDSGAIDLGGFWRTVNELCLCWSCGGQCGGKGEVGWCGPVELLAGRLVCDTCREQADVYDSERVGVAARIVDDRISLLVDPFQSYRKTTARLTPDEAVTPGMRLLRLAGELAIDAPKVETVCDVCSRPAEWRGGRWRHRDIADEVFCHVIGGGK